MTNQDQSHRELSSHGLLTVGSFTACRAVPGHGLFIVQLPGAGLDPYLPHRQPLAGSKPAVAFKLIIGAALAAFDRDRARQDIYVHAALCAALVAFAHGIIAGIAHCQRLHAVPLI